MKKINGRRGEKTMGGRYLVSGIQLGQLRSLGRIDVAEIAGEMEEQFLGDSDEDIKLDLMRLSGVFNIKKL